MKPVKIFTLTIASGLVGMALLALSASATTTALCTQDVLTACPAGSLVSHVHEVTSGHAKLLTNILTVECNVLFLGDVTSAGLLGNPLKLSGVFTYSSCLNGCVAEEKSALPTTTVLKEGNHLAKVIGEALVLVSCPAFGLHCTLVGVGVIGHALDPLLAEGGANGTRRTEDAEVKKDSKDELLFCPSSMKLDLLMSPLAPTYITS